MYGHASDKCGKQAEEMNPGEPTVEGGAGDDGKGTKEDGYAKKVNEKVNALHRPECSEIFGPWMIAKKPARRNNKNGKATSKGNGNQTKVTNEKFGENSRFAILGEETEETLETIDIERNQPNVEKFNNNGKQPMSKGRRPNVQVNEINNLANQEVDNRADNNENKQQGTSQKGRRSTQVHRANQAAALDEHTLVRGENNGATITTERIINNDNVDNVRLDNNGNIDNAGLGISIEEHYSDPPTIRNDMVEDGDEFWEGENESFHEEMDITG
nr:uncharacterized protein LOC109162703 [Ipomoea batatas]